MDILGCHECEKGGDLEDPEGLMGFVLLLTKSLPEGEGFFSAHSETTLSRESRNVFRDLNGRGQAPKGRLRIAGGERFPANPRSVSGRQRAPGGGEWRLRTWSFASSGHMRQVKPESGTQLI